MFSFQDYIKQASTMMSNLEKNTADGGAGDEQVEKLLRLREHLQVSWHTTYIRNCIYLIENCEYKKYS